MVPFVQIASCQHEHDLGSFYWYESGTVHKHRNLPNVIHSWGGWFDSETGSIYLASSAHTGDYETWTGVVFVTKDQGNNWVRLAESDASIGDFRTYDVIGFSHNLYIVWNDGLGEPCGIAVSENSGTSWDRIQVLNGQVFCYQRFIEYDERLVALNHEQRGVYTIDEYGAVDFHPFPGFQVPPWCNSLAVDKRGYLYIIADDQTLRRTHDLITWEIMTKVEQHMASIAYWPAKDWLVMSGMGKEARLWKVDLVGLTTR
jgi:hypothetical protein